jgi:proline iminopeptidase
VNIEGAVYDERRVQDTVPTLMYLNVHNNSHYWRHACFLNDSQLLRDAPGLDGVLGSLVHRRLDLSSPVDVPWQLRRRWPGSELVIVDEGRRSGGHGMSQALRAPTDRHAAGSPDA